MSETRLTTLYGTYILLNVHRDIPVTAQTVIHNFAKNPETLFGFFNLNPFASAHFIQDCH